MMPITLVIDRTFRGVGRIKKATGTTIPAVRRKMSRMLTALADEARISLLRDIRDGRLTLMEVYDAYQRGALDQLPTGGTAHPLGTAMLAWIDSLEPGVDYSEKHLISLETSRGYFVAADPDAPIADVPRLLEQLRESLGREHPRSFNMARSAASAFVRARFKKSHPLWAAIGAVEPRKVPKRAPRPELSPEWMRNVFPDPATDPVDAIAWGMATSGMGPSEYYGPWDVRVDRLHIGGTKRAARDRDVPLVRPPAVATIHRRTFEDKIRERTNRAVETYDLRRTFSRWMESAGVPRTRRKMYMGHAVGDVTELYERAELAAHLAADGTLIRTWLGLEPPDAAPQRLSQVK